MVARRDCSHGRKLGARRQPAKEGARLPMVHRVNHTTLPRPWREARSSPSWTCVLPAAMALLTPQALPGCGFSSRGATIHHPTPEPSLTVAGLDTAPL